MSEKMSKKATVLTYTEKELAAIEAFTANKGSKLTADELGIKPITVVGLMNKAAKVASGELANPDNLPVLNIVKEKVERMVTLPKEVTVFSIAD
jgi:phage major head subunit gpT-like protein